MIKLKNIHVFFNKGTQLENHVLRGLDLSIKKGDFVTIIGGNGAGKSTLMNVLAGDISPDLGQVIITGQDLSKQITEARTKQVARIFQDPMVGTFSHLTIEENLSLASKRGERRGLGVALKHCQRGIFRDKLKSLDMGLENRLGDRVSLLSGGQRQALSLVMATIQKAEVLLLDEHTAALDPKTAKIILELSRKVITEHSLTTLMITHSMAQALDFGDRTVFMQQGQVVRDLAKQERKALSPEDLLEFFS